MKYIRQMATAKTTKKNTPTKPKALATKELAATIRLIESHRPCSSGYYDFLKDVGGAPIDARYYDGWAAMPKKLVATIGPDTPITFKTIIALKKRRQCMSATDRINWLVRHGCLIPNAAAEAFRRAYSRLEDSDNIVLKAILRLDAAAVGKLIAP